MATKKGKRSKENSKDRLKKIFVSLYIEPWQQKALKELSEKSGAPMQHYMRAGVTLELAKHGMRPPQ